MYRGCSGHVGLGGRRIDSGTPGLASSKGRDGLVRTWACPLRPEGPLPQLPCRAMEALDGDGVGRPPPSRSRAFTYILHFVATSHPRGHSGSESRGGRPSSGRPHRIVKASFGFLGKTPPHS